MSMMQDQITYWINRSQMIERIMAMMVRWLDIDVSKLPPLQSYDGASAQPLRHTSGQRLMSGGENEAHDSDDT